MLKNQKLLSLIFLFSVTLVSLNGQGKIKFENISIIDGLSNLTIQAIQQDSEGFMWFGSSDGLNKFDGTKVTVYRDDPEDPGSIKGNLIISIYEDSEKNLWIGTEMALNKYNRDEDNFISYQIDSADTRQFYNGVVGIYEDSNKNLWIAKAYHGITFFDRDSSKFNFIKIDSTQESRNIFAYWNFMEDSNGELWCTMGRNYSAPSKLFKINKSKTKDYNITELVDLTDRQKTFSARIYKDPRGHLWFNTYDGYSIEYKPSDKSFKFHDIGEDIPIFGSVMDSKGNMWYASVQSGIVNYNPETKQIIIYKPDPDNPQSPSSQSCADIYIDASEIFWVGTVDKGVDKFDPFREPFEVYNITQGKGTDKTNNIIITLENSHYYKDRVWIGTDKGLYVFNKKDGTTQNAAILLKGVIADDIVVRTLEEDSENQLWIGTNSNGIYKINLQNNKVKTYKSDINIKTKLSSNSVRHILESSTGDIWAATTQGLNKFIKETNTFIRYKVEDTTYTSEVKRTFNEIRNKNKLISAIVKVPNYTDSTLTFELNNKKNVLIISQGESVRIQDGAHWDYGWLENDKGNIVWIADSINNKHAGGALKNRVSAEALSLEPGKYKLRYKSDDSHSYSGWNDSPPIDPQYWGVQVYEISDDQKDFLNNNLSKFEAKTSIRGTNIRALYEDSKGNIWIGTNNNGFSVYSPKTDIYKHYESSMSAVTGFTSRRVNAFLETQDGAMYVATFGGLIYLDPEVDKPFVYNIKHGLPTNYIVNLLEDNYGNVWLSSQKGLTQINMEENAGSMSFINYDMKDGLQAYQFSDKGALKLDDGRLMFGGANGFNVFYPGNINTKPPRVVITKLLISNEVMTTKTENSPLDKSINQMSQLNLSHNQADLSFEFTALHYARPDKNQYAHMLEGFDEDWVYDNRPFATYTNLDPGEYVFKVKASNSDGVWNAEGASISILINSPWWATIWAWASYIIIAGLIIFSFDKAQKNKIIRREREKQKIQEAELRAKAAEAESKLIQAESERKTKELEEARNLQLSMLPKVLPNLPHLDIAVYMQTATEVGGDYYDFHVSMDGTLTAVIGDATGHGLNAGTVVTVTKSLFNSHASNPDILYTFDEISRCLKEMKFKYLSMCLMILKIKGNQMQISAAGIPPALIFRKQTNTVEEFLIKGMPLGAPASLPYELKETEINSGDTILLMSDGFPELLSESKEMFGYDTAKLKFQNVAEKEPEEIISYLKTEGSKFVNGLPPHDDVTFVVIKVK